MINIITDTTSCLDHSYEEKYGIRIIPQVINFGSESFLEGVNLSQQEFIQKLKASKTLPTTSAPPPELFAEEFQKMQPDSTMLCIHPSAEVSGTVRFARMAAQDFPGLDIRVIDTRLVSSPLGSLVIKAVDWVKFGSSPEEIITRLKIYSQRCKIYFVVDTLEYLAKGGRIGGAKALLSGLLQIKPILTFSNGQVNPFDRERTHKRAIERIIHLVQDQAPHNREAMLSVMHADVPEEAQQIAQQLAELLEVDSVPVFNIPPAITTHGGPRLIGVGFFVAAGQ
jgi:DegV family protein with EDD domain